MTESDFKKIVELYDVMEAKLNELDITFDEFSILYKNFKVAMAAAAGVNTPHEEQKEETPVSPFPWVKYAGYGKYS